MDVLERASRVRGGRSGGTVAWDVLVAANCSRSRDRGPVDQRASAIDRPETETSGGSNATVFRLRIGDCDVEDLKQELLEQPGNDG